MNAQNLYGRPRELAINLERNVPSPRMSPLPFSGGWYVITASSLSSKSVKDLGRLADRYGIDRWRSLGKDSLIKAIVRATQKQLKSAQPKSSQIKATKTVGKTVANGKNLKNGKHETGIAKSKAKTPATKSVGAKPDKSRIVHTAHPANRRKSTKLKPKATSPRVQARIELARANANNKKTSPLAVIIMRT